jgi:hypothetical protein
LKADEDEIKAWKLAFRLTFNTFREMFGDVLKNLERSRGLLLQSASVAHFQEAQDARILFTQEFQSRQKRDIQEQMLAVVDWLAAEQSSALQHIELQQRRADFPLTAQWPFSIGAMRSWMRRNDVSSSIFWLCGIPGAGNVLYYLLVKSIHNSNVITQGKRFSSAQSLTRSKTVFVMRKLYTSIASLVTIHEELLMRSLGL